MGKYRFIAKLNKRVYYVWHPSFDRFSDSRPYFLFEAGCTLNHTVRHHNLVPVNEFVEEGIDISERGSKDRTALIKAAYCGYFSIVEYLVGKGSELDMQDSYGFTVLMYAVFTAIPQ